MHEGRLGEGGMHAKLVKVLPPVCKQHHLTGAGKFTSCRCKPRLSGLQNSAVATYAALLTLLPAADRALLPPLLPHGAVPTSDA